MTELILVKIIFGQSTITRTELKEDFYSTKNTSEYTVYISSVTYLSANIILAKKPYFP